MRSRLVTLLAVLIAAAGLGLVWFDKVQNDGIYHQDWRIENDPQADAAFRLGLSELNLAQH